MAEGIGRKYPAQSSPLSFATWPTALHHVSGSMMSSALSPDGKLLATGSGHPNSAGQIVVWSVENKTPVFVKHLNRGVRRLAFLPGSKSLIAAGFDGVARRLDASTGNVLREYRYHTDLITAAAVSVDGSRLATGGHDDKVVIWDLESGKLLNVLTGHTDDVLTVAFVPTEPWLVTAGRDLNVRIWNLETGELVRSLPGPTRLIEEVAVSMGGNLIAAASWDGNVWLWETRTGNALGQLRVSDARLCSLAFSPQGDFLASGSFDGSITVWDHARRAEIARFNAHSGAVFALSFREDGQEFVSNGWGGDARLWRNDGTAIASFTPKAAESTPKILDTAWSPDERRVAILEKPGGVPRRFASLSLIPGWS